MRTPFTLLAFVATLSLARADFQIQPNDSIMIGGDSITEQHIYSAFMEDYLLMCQPTEGQKIAQSGWSGEQAGNFLGRLDVDIYPYKPTVVTTTHGMNDGGYRPPDKGIQDNYRNNQQAIIDSLKKHRVRVFVLGSPKCVDSDYYHANNPGDAVSYNQTLSQLADIDKELAQKNGVIYGDVFGETTAVMKQAKAAFGNKYVFGGGDGVHPGPNGHLVMAYTFLKALGCDGNIGKITINLGLQQAEASPGHKIVSYKDGAAVIESTRYPFCFDGNPDATDPNDQNNARITKVFPFNQDLNRFILVVDGLDKDKAKVTWGNTTKEYTRDELKAGVNLAADFMSNPFVDQFHKVNQAVVDQQNNESNIMRNILPSIPLLKQASPKNAAVLDQVAADCITWDQAAMEKARALVIPIQHTITVVPE